MTSRAALVLALLPLLSCNPTDVPPAAHAAPPGVDAPLASGIRVEVAELQPSAAMLTLRLPGEVQGAREAMLGAALGGFVEAVHVADGQTVKKGKLLAEIDSALRAVALEQAQVQLEQAQDDLARIDTLGDLGTASQITGATNRVRLAEIGVKQAQLMLGRTKIRAPFSGVVAGVDWEPGEVANPGSPGIRLVQLHPAVVSLSVSDRDIVNLTEGMAMTVTADARLAPVDGVLKRILPAGDLKTRTFIAEVEVPNKDKKLLPGMIATAELSEVVATDALVIPQDYLVTRLDGLGVFVDDGGVAAWRPVVVESVVRDQAVIASGLTAGDRIVVTGHRDLAAGDALVFARQGQCCSGGRATF